MFAGGSSIRVPLEEKNGWMPDLKTIDKDVIKKSKILWLNYPNNPTGAVATKAFFEEAIESEEEAVEYFKKHLSDK